MNRFTYSYLSAFIIALIIITPLTYSQAPTHYLIEESRHEFYTNGTEKTPFIARGHLDIELPNTQDVLQYIRINISNDYTGNTNIVSPATFRDTAASPNAGDRSLMYFDTTDGYSLHYNITNHSLIPKITLKLAYKNAEGGRDIHSGSPNTILFNITITSDKTVTGHDLYFKIRENLYTADSMILGAASATSSTTLQTIDTDLDTYADTIYWQGDLTANTPVYITFPGTTQANINYDRNNQFLEINEQDSLKAEYAPSSTFTGITVTSRFSRGPIRQGVRMLFKDSVWLHGTITNKAQGLTYTLTDWALYNVTNLTQDIASGTVPAPQQLTPDQTYETPWHITNSSEHYYVSEFNWHVKWEPSEYLSTAATILDLPTLYQADGIAQKSISIVSTEPTRILDIEDFARHLGHPSIYFNATTITSTVPAGYTIQNITVWYSNITLGGSEYNITSNVTINLTSNILTITIDDISKILGKQLGLNEDILVRYQASGPLTSNGFTFTSTTTFILKTTSGTPLTLFASSSAGFPGSEEPEPTPDPDGSAPGGGGSSMPFASIEKSSAKIIAQKPTDTAEITAVFKIIDTSDLGIGSIRSEIILPSGSSLDAELVNLSIYDSLKKRWRTYTVDHLIIKKDPETTNNVVRYSVRLKSSDWDNEEQVLDLKKNDLYSITYIAALPYGNSNITTRLIGFNYYTHENIFKDIETYIRITYDKTKILPLEIRESEFQPHQIIVGKPPRWLKTIDVYNPNHVSVQHRFITLLFPEVISSHIRTQGTEINHLLDNNKEGIIDALWKDTYAPNGKKSYLIDITTPPILIMDEKYSIEKYNGTELIFTTDVTLKNPSSIDYENITMIYPVSEDRTRNITQNNMELKYEQGDTGTIKISIPMMKNKTTTTITLSYIKTPPILITNTDKPFYSPSEKLNLTIIFIPSENMSVSFIQIESITTSEGQTIYADIEKLQKLEERTPRTLHREFIIPQIKAGEYTIHTTATLNPIGEIKDTTTFRVESTTTELKKLGFGIIFLSAIAILASLVLRIYKRKEFKDELRNLRKEIENI